MFSRFPPPHKPSGVVFPGVQSQLYRACLHPFLFPTPNLSHFFGNAQDLTPLALELALWGCSDGSGLPWLDRPDAARLATAIELLDGLGAVDTKGRVTATGGSSRAGCRVRVACVHCCPLASSGHTGGRVAASGRRHVFPTRYDSDTIDPEYLPTRQHNNATKCERQLARNTTCEPRTLKSQVTLGQGVRAVT